MLVERWTKVGQKENKYLNYSNVGRMRQKEKKYLNYSNVQLALDKKNIYGGLRAICRSPSPVQAFNINSFLKSSKFEGGDGDLQRACLPRLSFECILSRYI